MYIPDFDCYFRTLKHAQGAIWDRWSPPKPIGLQKSVILSILLSGVKLLAILFGLVKLLVIKKKSKVESK